jgi:hypothetical protein
MATAIPVVLAVMANAPKRGALLRLGGARPNTRKTVSGWAARSQPAPSGSFDENEQYNRNNPLDRMVQARQLGIIHQEPAS